jgi:hypothetical protein
MGVTPAALSALAMPANLPAAGGVALRTHKALPDSLVAARAFHEKRQADIVTTNTQRFQTTCVQVGALGPGAQACCVYQRHHL